MAYYKEAATCELRGSYDDDREIVGEHPGGPTGKKGIMISHDRILLSE